MIDALRNYLLTYWSTYNAKRVRSLGGRVHDWFQYSLIDFILFAVDLHHLLFFLTYLPIILLYLSYPLSSFTLNLKPFFFSNLSLLSLFAPAVVRSLASWPGSLFHLIVISLLSFISTSFIYASVCE